MRAFLGVVIVTRNHGATIRPVLGCLAAQTDPADQVIVVDCASDDTGWAAEWAARAGFEVVLLGRNAGFAGGNNEGWRRLEVGRSESRPPTGGQPCHSENPCRGHAGGLVLFLNPDVIVPPDLLARLRSVMAEERSRRFGALGVRLVGWDFARACGTGAVDSTGVFPVWSGWRDRRIGSPPACDSIEEVPALCGAFFLARTEALRAVAFRPGEVWDERYVAYKEDVEISLRLQRAGWRIGVWHGAEAGHGRGWDPDRRKMPRSARLLSARNDVRLHIAYRPWKLPVSLAKLGLVRWLDW